MATKLMWTNYAQDPKTIKTLEDELDALFTEGYEIKATNTNLIILHKPDTSEDAMNLNLARVRDYLGLPDIRDENGRPLPINELLERIKATVNAKPSAVNPPKRYSQREDW